MDKFADLLCLLKCGFNSLLYPKDIKCIFCGDEITNEDYHGACNKCFFALEAQSDSTVCVRCGSQIAKDSSSVCFNCKRNNFDFEYARSCFVYDGIVKHAIYKFKYYGVIEYASNFAQFMAELFNSLDWKIDFVTSVPLFEEHQKKRGYNQATLLALQFCKLAVLPFYEVAERVKNTKTQTNLPSSERKENVKDAFKIKDDKEIKEQIKHKNILIIDDVYTTGATSNELAKVLKNAKASKVYVLTLAHTKITENL